jgi:hypothetical protein
MNATDAADDATPPGMGVADDAVRPPTVDPSSGPADATARRRVERAIALLQCLYEGCACSARGVRRWTVVCRGVLEPDSGGAHAGCRALRWRSRAHEDAEWEAVARCLLGVAAGQGEGTAAATAGRRALCTAWLAWTKGSRKVLHGARVEGRDADVLGVPDGVLDLGYTPRTGKWLPMPDRRPGRRYVLSELGAQERTRNSIYVSLCEAAWHRVERSAAAPMGAAAALAMLEQMMEEDVGAKAAALGAEAAAQRAGAASDWQAWARGKDAAAAAAAAPHAGGGGGGAAFRVAGRAELSDAASLRRPAAATFVAAAAPASRRPRSFGASRSGDLAATRAIVSAVRVRALAAAQLQLLLLRGRGQMFFQPHGCGTPAHASLPAGVCCGGCGGA